MERVRLGLTTKSLTSGAIVDVGQMQFAMRWIRTLNPQGSLFRMSYLLGGQSKHQFHFCIDSNELVILFQYMAGTLNNPSAPDTGPKSIQIFNSTYAAIGRLSFDFCVLAQLQNNVNLYGFTLIQSDPKGVLIESLAFNLTSTDAQGIFGAIDGLIYSNPPKDHY